MDGSANPIFFEFLNKNIAFGTYDMLNGRQDRRGEGQI